MTDQQELLEAVVLESTQRLRDEANTTRGNGGNLPIDTGFLRSSVYGPSTDKPPLREAPEKPADWKKGNAPIYSPPAPTNLLINWQPGTPIFIGWLAKYAAAVNDRGALFLDLAAQRWPQIVDDVVAELANRLGRK